MAKTLAHFTITRTGDDYILQLEDEDGDTTEFIASYEHLDLITEAVEEQLDADEDDLLAVDDDDDEDVEIED